MSVIPQPPIQPIRDQALVLPLLSFSTGAADGFAYLALGGIFTANMTGNAVLATVFTRPGYETVLAGALTAIGAFALALAAGFRMTRARGNDASLVALIASALCLAAVALWWWFGLHTGLAVFGLITLSAAAMALQTVAAKRDGVPHGATTTYATGTLTDLVGDIVDGKAPWSSPRWLVLLALPAGALLAVGIALYWPAATPLLPLVSTTASIGLIRRRRAG